MSLPYSPEALAFRNDLVLAICNGGFGKHYEAADAFMASHVAPLLAALQRVTAERDEYAETLMQVAEAGGWQASAGLAHEVRSALATTTAEAASLRAEVEAKDRALTSIIEMNVQYAIDRYGDAGRAEEMACVQVARAALARAATAREGRSDG